MLDTNIHKSHYPSTFYRVSLKAVIRNEDNEILVNKEGACDTWNLPGGDWDHGETEYEALSRELQEEVGYTGKFTAKPTQTAVFWLESKQAWLLWIVYDVKPENYNFSIGSHSSKVAFVPPKLFKNATSFEEQWMFNNLCQPIPRKYTHIK